MPLPPTHALTLWQPMCAAVIYGSKKIENRPWPPPKWVLGKRIWIHAGLQWSDEHAVICRRNDPTFPYDRDELLRGVILGSARVVDAFHRTTLRQDILDDPWWMGPWGWLLDDIEELRCPIECRGAQKLWQPPPHIQAKCLAAENE